MMIGTDMADWKYYLSLFLALTLPLWVAAVSALL